MIYSQPMTVKSWVASATLLKVFTRNNQTQQTLKKEI